MCGLTGRRRDAAIGSADLITEMASAGQHEHHHIREACDGTAGAIRIQRKFMGVRGVRQDGEFQSWLIQLEMGYLTGGSDLGYIPSAHRADVKRVREEVRLC